MFRRARKICPGCAEPMEEHPVPLAARSPSDVESAAIDLCGRCGGVFIEFFDGEPTEVARGVLERHLEAQRRGLRRASAPVRGCPDCARPLVTRRYLERGPQIWRCGVCMAVFVTAAQLVELAAYRPDDASETPSVFERLRACLFDGLP